MLVSRCCQSDLFVEADYYVCDTCHRPCHTVCVINLEEFDDHGYGNALKIEEIFD